jgi:hypothetical protein
MKKLALLVVMVSLTGMVGCGFEGFGCSEADVNDLAKAAMPGTWADPAGQVSITFDENCQITGFTFPSLPPELANVTFDGSTFTIPIPGQAMTVSAALVLQTATVDDAGNVVIEYRGELAGFAGMFDPGYVQIIINGQLDNPSNPTDFSGSVSAVAYPSPFLQSLAGLQPEISISEAAYFDASKSL